MYLEVFTPLGASGMFLSCCRNHEFWAACYSVWSLVFRVNSWQCAWMMYRERKRQKLEAIKEVEKLLNRSVVLITQMQYNLFRNMQIQQSLCHVYRRDLLIQRLKEKERLPETPTYSVDTKAANPNSFYWFSLNWGNEVCREISYLFTRCHHLHIYSGYASLLMKWLMLFRVFRIFLSS